MLEDRSVALVIAHAPNAEREFLARHPEWRYQKLATNRFILVGPRCGSCGSTPCHECEGRVRAHRRIAGGVHFARGWFRNA